MVFDYISTYIDKNPSIVEEYYFIADLLYDVNAHDCHEIDHVEKTLQSSDMSASRFFQDYICAVCDMFNFVKTSQIHLHYTEMKKSVICKMACWGF